MLDGNGATPGLPQTRERREPAAPSGIVTHDHSEMCVSCNSKAVGKCRCGRRVCGGCVDGETGLCAYCDDVVVDARVDAVETECYA